MSEIKRNDPRLNTDTYAEMMQLESHHNHKIIEDDHGIYRWLPNTDIEPFMENISLNDLCPLLNLLGYDKNSEVYRKLYRDMGYSLSGYWEVFHWDWNNEDCELYEQPNLVENKLLDDLLTAKQALDKITDVEDEEKSYNIAYDVLSCLDA